MSPKRARTGSPKQLGSGRKIPKVDERAVRPDDAGSHVIVSFRHADRSYAGEWSWMTDGHAHEMVEFLCNIGGLTWNEVKGQLAGSKGGAHKKHHFMAIDLLCPEAKKRIAQLQLVDIFGDQIFRFRLGNKKRLWGFIAAGVFYVLWWDATHAVYPLDRD